MEPLLYARLTYHLQESFCVVDRAHRAARHLGWALAGVLLSP